MREDDFYSGEEEQVYPGRKEASQNAPQQGIYKEGTHQRQGEYRDPETDFQKNTYQQVYGEPYREPYQPVSQGFGIASLALGIASLVLFCSCLNVLLAILAIIFGIIQLTVSGSKKGMALGGIVTAGLSLLLFAVFLIGWLGSVDFQEGFQRELYNSIQEQIEDGDLRNYRSDDQDEDDIRDDYDDILDTF